MKYADEKIIFFRIIITQIYNWIFCMIMQTMQNIKGLIYVNLFYLWFFANSERRTHRCDNNGAQCKRLN